MDNDQDIFGKPPDDLEDAKEMVRTIDGFNKSMKVAADSSKEYLNTLHQYMEPIEKKPTPHFPNPAPPIVAAMVGLGVVIARAYFNIEIPMEVEASILGLAAFIIGLFHRNPTENSKQSK